MNAKLWCPILVITAVSTTSVVQGALSDQLSDKAIAQLRSQGPAGLDSIFTQYAADIQRHRSKPTVGAQDKNWIRLTHALDTVAGQRDAYASGLYWYTDLNAAKKAAQASGKPILSLRLLGKLTDEYSCANSRFFRTALYSNLSVSKELREKFILHWQTERPVPVVTIDIGDGRVVKRTLTGNSIHYLLDANGRPLDALPGLYGPGAFKRWLDSSQTLFTEWNQKAQGEQEPFLQQYHNERIDTLAKEYVTTGLGMSTEGEDQDSHKSVARALLETPLVVAQESPSAEVAGNLALGKRAAEFPLLNVTSLYASAPTRTAQDDSQWQKMAINIANDAVLDENSLNLMRSKTRQIVKNLPVKSSAGQVASLQQAPSKNAKAVGNLQQTRLEKPSTARVPSVFPGQSNWSTIGWSQNGPDVVISFQKSIALDSVRNEYRMHAPLHAWFAKGEVNGDMETLNKRVYDELFLTSRSDPWLGLAPTGLYTALPDDGLIQPVTK
jgi:hypothetical protein